MYWSDGESDRGNDGVDHPIESVIFTTRRAFGWDGQSTLLKNPTSCTDLGRKGSRDN